MSEAELTAVIQRVTYFNEATGYCVLKVAPVSEVNRDELDRDGVVTVVGVMVAFAEGETVRFSGQWVNNATYGRQFKAERFVPVQPQNERGIVRYLQERIPGVGQTTAQRIYQHFGEETLSILEREPERLRELGLKQKIIDNTRQALQENRLERLTIVELQNYGITPNQARKIYAQYGPSAREILRTDPYQLATDVYGIGFKRADQIARAVGIAHNSRERVRAGLVFTVEQLTQEGHTFIPRATLIEEAARLLDVDDRDLISSALSEQIVLGLLISDTLHRSGQTIEAVYAPVLYHSEHGAARRIRDQLLMPSKLQEHARSVDWPKFLAELSKQHALKLTPQQQGAVKAVFECKLSVLTGGPGTGKTTTLRMVINALEQAKFSYALASPTGRAAKRLSEASGRLASTIHRLLEFSPFEGGFARNEDHPLECDVLIIDESSMMDLVLFYNVLKALPQHAHLMLVGDVDQLPSVGAGNVLRDVIDSGHAFVTRLKVIFRQDDKSHIVQNAHRINHGEMPYLSNDSHDFFFFQINDNAKVGEMVVDVVENRIPSKFGFDPMNDIQVLAPMYRGPAGVDAINQALQARLNGGVGLAELRIGQRRFRMNDKIMQTKNNYEKDVFNGDMGRVIGLDATRGHEKLIVRIDDKEIEYDYQTADEQLLLAYCISTHRSQGSEYPVVVMPITTSHYMMLQRNLLYTAITRAKKLVVLIGDRQAVSMAVRNDKVTQRYSGLLPRLKALAL